ncbi:ABC transporter permease OS=Streptomyces alboniger OX=132473 GN=CP975_21885 PE=4 SV=1 [Streptomyces alboniger]
MEQRGAGEATYIVMLSVVPEGLALLTLGLVREWGEIVPAWVPGLGGRRMPTPAAVVSAPFGALALFAAMGWALYARLAGLGREGGVTDGTAQHVLLVVRHVPLIAWPPLLTAIALACYRRRTARASSVAA